MNLIASETLAEPGESILTDPALAGTGAPGASHAVSITACGTGARFRKAYSAA